jgi:hypothetical protein
LPLVELLDDASNGHLEVSHCLGNLDVVRLGLTRVGDAVKDALTTRLNPVILNSLLVGAWQDLSMAPAVENADLVDVVPCVREESDCLQHVNLKDILCVGILEIERAEESP